MLLVVEAVALLADRLTYQVRAVVSESAACVADPIGLAPAECSQVADTPARVRRQMLVGMNAATVGGGTRLLADGNQVPVLGLGVWQVPDGRECVDAVRWALEAGYRHNRRALPKACSRHNVAVEAYSPLGTGRYVADATVAKIAQRTGRTPAQVLLRWSLQHGLIVIAKSTHRVRIQENAQIFDFALSADDMAELDALDRTGGTDRALESTWW
jgi:hypothetical protein